MATNDEGLVALVEAWMIAQIKTANDANSKPLNLIDHYEGSIAAVAKGQVDELFKGRQPFALVQCEDGFANHLSANDLLTGSRYLVLIGVAISRPDGSPRIGDGETVGVHFLRRMISDALHDQHPGVTDAWGAGEVCRDAGWETLWRESNRWVIAGKFEIDEVPKA